MLQGGGRGAEPGGLLDVARAVQTYCGQSSTPSADRSRMSGSAGVFRMTLRVLGPAFLPRSVDVPSHRSTHARRVVVRRLTCIADGVRFDAHGRASHRRARWRGGLEKPQGHATPVAAPLARSARGAASTLVHPRTRARGRTPRPSACLRQDPDGLGNIRARPGHHPAFETGDGRTR